MRDFYSVSDLFHASIYISREGGKNSEQDKTGWGGGGARPEVSGVNKYIQDNDSHIVYSGYVC